jgi:hypothetical protein
MAKRTLLDRLHKKRTEQKALSPQMRDLMEHGQGERDRSPAQAPITSRAKASHPDR